MFEFLTGKKKYLGIDFGTSSIKVVELSVKEQTPYLENYGIVELNWLEQDQKNAAQNTSYEQKINEALKKLLIQMKVHGGEVFVSIPGFSGLITIIEMPEMENEELAKAIQFEAHKYIPSSLDEIAMSWEVVEKTAESESAGVILNSAPKLNDNKKIKVLLVAAPKKDIDRYDRLVSGCELEVGAIELETFSIARSIVGDDPGINVIVDIGARATNIILVENGIVKVNRNIDAGGSEITAAISESMNISKQRAETFKKGERDFINGKQTALIIPVLELITGELRRILGAYEIKNNKKVEQLIISGGTSQLKGLDAYFSQALAIKVVMGNPWRKIVCEDKVLPLANKLGSSFAVAIGLALRGIEQQHKN